MSEPEMRTVTITDLSQEEKDRVIELLLDRLDLEISAYKFDGESNRIVGLRKLPRQRS